MKLRIIKNIKHNWDQSIKISFDRTVVSAYNIDIV